MARKNWKIFTGSLMPHNGIADLPDPPPWRTFRGQVVRERQLLDDDEAVAFISTRRGSTFQTTGPIVEMVNAALYLRRPLLVTGKPGTGKSSLIYAVAYELKLGEVLRWPITSKSVLQQALYQYDAIGRLQDTQLKRPQARSPDIGQHTAVATPLDTHADGTSAEPPQIGEYLKLGPLGTALLPTNRPRALLIDEIDKSDIDLPNDLLNIFEEGEFDIPELARLKEETIEVWAYGSKEKFSITRGKVQCRQFPFVVLTSNGEREFPAPFLRRCLRLELPEPDDDLLSRIVAAHLGESTAKNAIALITDFANRLGTAALATDQLLNAIYLVMGERGMSTEERQRLIDAVFRELTS